jgi:adenosine deaminase
MRIGGLREPSYHPLRNFIDHHIPVTIATDDPGIFNITLSGEEDFVRTNLGVSDQQLHQANDLAGRLMLQSINQQFMANN